MGPVSQSVNRLKSEFFLAEILRVLTLWIYQVGRGPANCLTPTLSWSWLLENIVYVLYSKQCIFGLSVNTVFRREAHQYTEAAAVKQEALFARDN